MISWTIGAGGLLGSALRSGGTESFTAPTVPWGDPAASAQVLADGLARFRNAAGDGPWAIHWAAGAATVATTEAQAWPELAALKAVLDALRAQPPAGPGAFFLTSSAGGVFAGSAHPPFDGSTRPVPMSPYGELKMAQEAATAEALTGVCPVVIGRISNLYGPGQNLAKLQGLISRLAMAAAVQEPLNIFVSLDTLRDYIHVTDAAACVRHWVDVAVRDQPTEPQVRIIASGEAVTVGQLIRTMHLVTKRRVPTALGSHPSATRQVLDLRLTPTDAGSLVRLPHTPLPVGMKDVYLDILARLQQDSLATAQR